MTPETSGTSRSADSADEVNGVTIPSIEDTKAIAQEAFVYGLPIVMNYAATHELFLNPTSAQYKGPLNRLVNEARVFTYKDKCRDSQQRYAIFLCLS